MSFVALDPDQIREEDIKDQEAARQARLKGGLGPFKAPRGNWWYWPVSEENGVPEIIGASRLWGRKYESRKEAIEAYNEAATYYNVPLYQGEINE